MQNLFNENFPAFCEMKVIGSWMHEQETEKQIRLMKLINKMRRGRVGITTH